jgi:hypothetical protein
MGVKDGDRKEKIANSVSLNLPSALCFRYVVYLMFPCSCCHLD